MKTIVTFLSVIVLVSSGKLISGAFNTMKISNLKERTHIFNPTATPPANVQINDLPEEHVPHITDQGYIGFVMIVLGLVLAEIRKWQDVITLFAVVLNRVLIKTIITSFKNL
ncbi:hypothetical protein Bca52824_069065 [Brassica carinata]|uniref:Uncharacterized protein n=1 Tax=Brassica carinata TaxID=52824 RepID=A0A8X7Q1N4_BRACI|nr:hypothetical protein Bca52824_069065 [Brassica carinata]